VSLSNPHTINISALSDSTCLNAEGFTPIPGGRQGVRSSFLTKSKKLSRNKKIYLSQRLTGKRLDDIGRKLGMGDQEFIRFGEGLLDR
jgi:hypothetical protein